ncbi:hypothetical protein GAYE_SCF20G4098 [Galdieria yellowstonensis]|uniref:40S ribosomal protein S19 n=1 Tax=Galdieria yellowstonensis TaxID=3028027 RepID=A0AAV9IFT8_9RHOD|nr:hypothetical protein GAYE_SCF20G4098 [Galdieria yellowstonensis]
MDNKIGKRGGTLKDVSAPDFIASYANFLKRTGNVELPSWVDYVKTSTRNELAPYDPDWFYVRMAALARQIYIRPGRGVGAFRRVYGGRKRRGSKPSHFALASSSVIRHALRQLEKLEIIEKTEQGGRRLTRKGRQELDLQAQRILSSQ